MRPRTRPTFRAYRDIHAVNWSSLKHIGTSPAHYLHHESNPTEDTTRLLLGRGVHAAVLEPDSFPLEFAVYEGGARRGKEWAAFASALAGRGILKPDEYQLCLNVRDAVRANPHAAELLTGDSEVTLEWIDETTGLDCKARVDHISAAGALVDLKTAASIEPRDFQRSAFKFGYYGQMAFYARAISPEPIPVYMIAVEIAPPHDVVVYELDEYALDYGDALVDEYLGRLRECLDTDVWPGRYEEVQMLGLPAWMEQASEDGWEGLA